MNMPQMLLLFSTIERHKTEVRDLSEVLKRLLDCLADGSALYEARIEARSTYNRITKEPTL